MKKPRNGIYVLSNLFRIEDDNKNWADLAKFGAVLIEGEMTPVAIKQIQSINPHIIFIDVNTNIHNCNIVRNDFVEETSHILDTLYNLGHKNIVYIGEKSLVLDLDGKIDSEKMIFVNSLTCPE